MPGPDALQVLSLSVRYPRRTGPRPDAVSLRLAAGERLLVLGPSGCGKSSLLRAVAGIIPEVVDAEVSGRVLVCGQDTNGEPIHRIAEHIGFLAQDPLDQVVLSRVDDEVAFGLESDGVPPAEIGPRVAEVLARTGSTHLAARDTATLSGGELQRVALAAVLVRRPAVLLLDEPAAMLDPVARQRIHSLLGLETCASIMVEHALDTIALAGCQILVLTGSGSLLTAGPARQVLVEHASEISAAGCWLPVGVGAALTLGRRPTTADLDDPGPALADVAAGVSPDAQRVRPCGVAVLSATEAAFRAHTSRRSPIVVRGASLELHAGSVTALVGANGSGKTSTLLGLAGLLPLCRGNLTVDGRVGMVFQHPEHQFLRRSVADEVRFGTALADTEVERLIHDFGLDGLNDLDPFRLSGGQQRRLSIAAAVAHRPDVLLLDEPTFGQDAANARSLAGLIRSLADDGVTVAMVTHDLRMVAAIADQVSVVRDGVVAPGRPAQEVLRDEEVLHHADVRLPEELEWWRRHGADVDLRGFMHALHDQRVIR